MPDFSPFKDLSTEKRIAILFSSVSIQGELSQKFGEFCISKIQEKPRPIHLNLRSVKYVDSSFISSLLRAVHQLKSLNLKVHIDAPTIEILHLLKGLMIDKLVECSASEDHER